MLEIGVQTKGILPEMSIEEGFAKIAKAGFTKIDFNMDNYLKNTDLYAGKTNKFFDYDMDALADFFFPYLLEMKKNGITYKIS